MGFGSAKIAGTLLLIGSIQFVLALVIAEAIYSGYSTSANYISDLGVWGRPSALFFNPSIVLFGSLNLASSYFIKKEFKLGRIAYLFALAAVGTLTVGLFPENTVLVNGFPIVHGVAALLTFVVGGVAAIASYKYTKSPFKIFSLILGFFTLLAFALFLSTMGFGYLGIGVGGMERMIVYPTILWILGLGGYLLNT
jgi:hypothetical membrane protein